MTALFLLFLDLHVSDHFARGVPRQQKEREDLADGVTVALDNVGFFHSITICACLHICLCKPKKPSVLSNIASQAMIFPVDALSTQLYRANNQHLLDRSGSVRDWPIKDHTCCGMPATLGTLEHVPGTGKVRSKEHTRKVLHLQAWISEALALTSSWSVWLSTQRRGHKQLETAWHITRLARVFVCQCCQSCLADPLALFRAPVCAPAPSCPYVCSAMGQW